MTPPKILSLFGAVDHKANTEEAIFLIFELEGPQIIAENITTSI